MKSDADILRDAKLEAMGLHPEDHEPRRTHERPQMATDEIVRPLFLIETCLLTMMSSRLWNASRNACENDSRTAIFMSFIVYFIPYTTRYMSFDLPFL